MSLKSAILFGILMLVFISCTKDNTQNIKKKNNFEVQLGYVMGVSNLVSTGRVNETIDIGIHIRGGGGFKNFIETKLGNTTTIGVETLVCTDCITQGVTPNIMNNYPFKASTPGVYYLKFISSPTTVIMDSLIISE